MLMMAYKALKNYDKDLKNYVYNRAKDDTFDYLDDIIPDFRPIINDATESTEEAYQAHQGATGTGWFTGGKF